MTAGAGEQWRGQLQEMAGKLRDLYTQGQVMSKADDAQCGVVVPGDENHVDVVVLVQQTAASLATGGKPTQTQLPVVSTMDRVDGRWVVSKVTIAQNAATPAPAPR